MTLGYFEALVLLHLWQDLRGEKKGLATLNQPRPFLVENRKFTMFLSYSYPIIWITAGAAVSMCHCPHKTTNHSS